MTSPEPGACGCHAEADPLSEDSAILVVINPESRVSANWAGRSPRLAGGVVDVPVRITNRGFVTAALMARLIAPSERDLDIQSDDRPLSGAESEQRRLVLRPRTDASLDVTICFHVERGAGDLGGRDRVSIFLQAGGTA